MKKYFLPVAIILLIMTFFLGFINIDKFDVADINSEEVITYGVEKVSEDLKDISNLSKREEDIICAVSKGLVAKNIEDKIIPSLASEVNESSDGIQYEFKIRNDIFWSDGTKITADDVATFLKELLRDEKEENVEALLDIYGAKEFKTGKTTFEKGVAVKAVDDTLIIRLNKKNSNFLNELTKPQYRLRKYLVMWERINKNYDKLVYSGDYKIEYIDNSKLVLKINNTSANSMPKEIDIVKDGNVELSMAAFEIKQRDLVVEPPESQLNKLNSQGKLITIPKTNRTYLSINNRENMISAQGKREIYRDICKAIEEYQSQNEKEFEIAEGSYFREEKDDLTKLQARKVNVNQEGQWDRPKVLTILSEDNNDNRVLCRAIEKWFKENSDVTIKYSLVNDDEFKDKELQKRYDMILINNNADQFDKYSFYSDFEEYFTDYQSKIFQSLNINDANEIYAQIEENMFENYNVLPLVFYNENIAFSDKISSIEFDGNGNIDFSTIK